MSSLGDTLANDKSKRTTDSKNQPTLISPISRPSLVFHAHCFQFCDQYLFHLVPFLPSYHVIQRDLPRHFLLLHHLGRRGLVTRYAHLLRYVQGGQAILASTCLNSMSIVKGNQRIKPFCLKMVVKIIYEKFKDYCKAYTTCSCISKSYSG